VIDPAVKYGGGDETIQTTLLRMSNVIAEDEVIERALLVSLSRENLSSDDRHLLVNLREEYHSSKEKFLRSVQGVIDRLLRFKEDTHDLPD
jgi:hypothetical protein